MNTINLIASFALLAGASAVFAHNSVHAANTPTVKEQKEWGIAGETTEVKRTITIAMSDQMRFSPDNIRVKQGETVRLVIHNTGRMQHELVIGTPTELDAHAALMLRFPDMQHDEPYMAHVAPGKTGQLIWTFNRAGNFDFACLMAGHYQAGMVGRLHVTAAP